MQHAGNGEKSANIDSFRIPRTPPSFTTEKREEPAQTQIQVPLRKGWPPARRASWFMKHWDCWSLADWSTSSYRGSKMPLLPSKVYFWNFVSNTYKLRIILRCYSIDFKISQENNNDFKTSKIVINERKIAKMYLARLNNNIQLALLGFVPT